MKSVTYGCCCAVHPAKLMTNTPLTDHIPEWTAHNRKHASRLHGGASCTVTRCIPRPPVSCHTSSGQALAPTHRSMLGMYTLPMCSALHLSGQQETPSLFKLRQRAVLGASRHVVGDFAAVHVLVVSPVVDDTRADDPPCGFQLWSGEGDAGKMARYSVEARVYLCRAAEGERGHDQLVVEYLLLCGDLITQPMMLVAFFKGLISAVGGQAALCLTGVPMVEC